MNPLPQSIFERIYKFLIPDTKTFFSLAIFLLILSFVMYLNSGNTFTHVRNIDESEPKDGLGRIVFQAKELLNELIFRVVQTIYSLRVHVRQV